ncbi:MAG: PQQ-dependent sugar dehydrogenase [Parcubacteria group bacterium]|nr:PQQ-dependent sugar dehydrogenase [Parcubacteria group bacterium]
MKKSLLFILGGGVIVAALIWASLFYVNPVTTALWPWLSGNGVKTPPKVEPTITSSVSPVNTSSPTEAPVEPNTTGLPLSLPLGFSIATFAKDLSNARVLAFDARGNLWVSQTKKGIISLLEIEDGKVIRQNPVLRNLNNPHGLDFDPFEPFTLYFAEEDRISKIPVYSDAAPVKIADLPSGGGHFTRTLGFGPDDRLYVSIGSSCNVCNEGDERRAKIFSMNPDGSDFREFARGLRNAVFFAWHPITDELWATENGRDLLGDDIPPDEINIIREGSNYGWPNCYGKNIHDTAFDKNTYIRNPCMEPFEIPSAIDVQAHSAPLGLAFIPDSWPEEYRDDLLVAYHGSWNRSVPTGYKVVRMKLDREGNFLGEEDFITGWLRENNEVLGRPVDLIFHEGALYISDDKAGVIYRVDSPK